MTWLVGMPDGATATALHAPRSAASYPPISVVIPLYNKADYVRDALESIAAQSVMPSEVIVVDDGSTDGGDTVAEQTNVPGLRILRQANSGVSAARNRGFEAAKSGLVALLDADDVWNVDHLRHLSELAAAFPDAALYANTFAERQRVTGKATPASGEVAYRATDDFIAEAAVGRSWIFTSAAMVRKTAFLASGGFHVGESRGEDIDLWVRIGLKQQVALSSYVGCIYRRSASSLTATPVRAPDVAMRTIEGLKNQSGLSAKHQFGLTELYCRLALAHATDCLLHGEVGAARKFLRLSRCTRSSASRRRLLVAIALTARVGSLPVLRFVVRYLAERRG